MISPPPEGCGVSRPGVRLGLEREKRSEVVLVRRFFAAIALGAVSLTACSGGTSIGTASSGESGGVPAPRPSASSGSGGATSAPSTAPSTPESPGGSVALPSPSPSTGAVQSSALAVPFAPTPDSDPFYAQPASFANATPGTILASRSITYEPDMVPQQNPAWQLKFVSRDNHGNPIAAITTVVKPTTQFTGGQTPLLSVQYYTNSLGLSCAPSHAVTGGTTNSEAEGSFPLIGLEQGYALVIPDHLGPSSEYAAGLTGGQITLDSIRAALAFAPLGLNARTPVGMEGYSGGSISTIWAASIANAYAPQINLVAAASGGTVAITKDVIGNLGSFPASEELPLGISALLGINRAFPQLVTPILNAAGVKVANATKDGCGGATTDGSAAPTGAYGDYTTIPNPLDNPAVDAILAADDMPVAGHMPTIPLYIYQSEVDEFVPVADTTALVNSFCATGEHVAYYIGATGEHIAFSITMAPTVFTYFTSRFSNLPEIVPPGSTTCN